MRLSNSFLLLGFLTATLLPAQTIDIVGPNWTTVNGSTSVTILGSGFVPGTTTCEVEYVIPVTPLNEKDGSPQRAAASRLAEVTFPCTVQSPNRITGTVPGNNAIFLDGQLIVRNALTAFSTFAFRTRATGTTTPSLSSLSVSSKVFGSGQFNLGLIGTGFDSSAQVFFVRPGSAPQQLTPVNVTSASNMTVPFPASLMQQIGTGYVYVVMSASALSFVPVSTQLLQFDVVSPSISSLNPPTIVAGSGATSLTLNGSFPGAGSGALSSQVRFTPPGGALQSLTPTSSSETAVIVTVPATLLTTTGAASVQLNLPFTTPLNSNTLSLPITQPPPVISSITPPSVAVGSPTRTFAITGSNFLPGSQTVTFTPPGGSATTLSVLVSPTPSGSSFSVSVPGTLLTSLGTGTFSVSTAGGTATANITITRPVISTTAPASFLKGAAASTLTVNGTDFNIGGTPVLEFTPPGGAATNLTPSSSSATTLTATVPSPLLAAAGNASIRVISGTASSLPATIPINGPVISSLTPPTAVQNGATLNVTIAGTGFTLGGTPTATWTGPGGSPVTGLTVVGTPTATSMVVTVPASLLTSVGNAQILVTTGTATSSSSNFAITASAPALTSSNPSNLAQNTATTVTLSGTNLSPLTSITFTPPGGSAQTLTPASSSATSITVNLSAAQLANTGNGVFTVTTGVAPPATLNIAVAVPSITLTNPATVLKGATSALVTLSGTFNVGASTGVGRWISPSPGPTSDFTLSFPTAGVATFTVGAAELANAGTATVRVVAGGALSNPVTISVVEPVISSLNPPSALQNAPTFTLILSGTNLNTGGTPVVRFTPPGGSATVLTLNATPSIGSISAVVPTTLLTASGVATVTVQTGSAISAAANFNIGSGPAITSLAPTLAVAGSAQISPLVITGANFTAAGTPTAFFVPPGGSPVALSNTATPTATSMSVTVPASLLANTGAAAVFVRTGSTDSPNATFTIAPAPFIEFLTPSVDFAGAPDLQVSIFGGNFTGAGSPTVLWTRGNIVTNLAISGTPTTTGIVATVPAALLATPGTATITVQVGGVNSLSQTFTILPTPSISLLSPSSTAAGGPAFTLTINGANLQQAGYGATVRFNTTTLTPLTTSATSITVTVPQTLIATAGSFPVTVTLDPLFAPGALKGLPAVSGRLLGEVRNVSNALNFTVTGPAPSLTSLNPGSATAGGAAFTLTIAGSGFSTGDTIDFTGTSITPTSISATQIVGTVPAAAITAPGVRNVRVLTSANTPSNTLTFRVNYNITSLNPSFATAGGAQFPLTVNATAVLSGAQIVFNGNPLTTTGSTATSVTANVPAALIATQNVVPVTLTDGTLISNSLNFNVLGAVNVTSLNPASVQAGSGQLTLQVTGSGFDSGSTVLAIGNAVSSTFQSATQMTATIPAGLIANAGTVAISVRDSNQRVSNAVDLQVLAPIVISSLNPTFAQAGGTNLNLTVSGSGFANGMTVFAGTTALTSAFGSATQMTATIPASLIANAGSLSITVRDSNQRTSNAVSLPVLAGLSVTTLNPTFLQAGGATSSLTVNGANFDAGSTVLANGSPLSSQFVSATQMTATVPASLIATPGSLSITVRDSNQRTSNAVSLPVLAGLSITTLNPTFLQAGGATSSLTVNGANFDSGSTVLANGSPLSSQFVSGTQMTATVPASLIATPGSLSITVRDSNQRTSNAVSLPVLAGLSITTLNPTFLQAGGATSSLTVNGANFDAGSTVLANGSPLSSQFVSATQMTATVPASLIATPGSLSITVRDSNQRTSNAVSLPVLAGLSITTLNPTFLQAGGAASSLTVNGANFDSGSTVLANGSPLSSQFVSATQMTATVPASLIATPGSLSITVRDSNQRTSNAVPLQVLSGLTVTTLNPSFAPAGSGSLQLTVSGTSFDNGSTVLANGSPIGSVFVNETQMTATVPAVLLVTPGSVSISVRDSRSRTSNAVALPVLSGLSITSLSPAFREAGAAAFTLTVNGTAFDDASVVLSGATTLTTTFVSATQLQALVPAALVASTGSLSITVRDARSRVSNAFSFPVLEPIRIGISALQPSFRDAGSAGFTLTVGGSGFESVSTVNFNGTPLATSMIVPGAFLNAIVPASLIASAGTANVTVTDNRGRTSNSVPFNILTPLTISSLSPSFVEAGSVGFTLTLNGTGFSSGMNVVFGGSSIAANVLSSTQATVSIPAASVANAGPVAVLVQSQVPVPEAAPVTRQSNTVNLQVLSPVSLTSLNPSRANAGVQPFTMTVGGTGFTNGAVIRFNNANLTTTFVSAATLTGVVPAAVVGGPGNTEVQVQLPDGRISTPLPFVILPQLRLSQISPPATAAGANSFTMTLTGDGFSSESVVRIGGLGVPTTFVSATQLTALVNDSFVANPATLDVTVANPLGAVSNAISFSAGGTIAITSLNPPGAPSGSNAVTISLTGTGFTNSTVVRFGTTDLPTTFVNNTQLNALIPAQLLTVPGNFAITAAAGTTVSNAVNFEVGGRPELNFLNPDAITAGSRSFTLIGLGRGFLPGSTIRFGDDELPTTFVSGTQVSAVVNASLLATARTVAVTVVNPNGAASNSRDFRIVALSLTSLTPDKATAGGPAIALAVEGTGFLNGAIISFGGRSLITNFGGATRLSAQIPADALVNAGRINVTVGNPDGAVSNAVPFTVESDTPTISRINPSSIVAGTGEVTIAVTGGGFVRGSSVTANGNGLATTFNSATSLDAVVPADLSSSLRNLVIKVVNPGNKESNELGLSIVAPTPAISSVTPPSVNAGSTVDIPIAIAGTGFIQGASVTFNGNGVETTFNSATSLSAVIPAASLPASGNAAIQVVNPGDVRSNTVQFNILGAVTVTSVNPTSLSAGGTADPVITVAGTGFVNGSAVLFGGAALPTTFGSSTSLTATVPQNLLTTARGVSVTVRNPNGAVSNGVNLSVTPPVPGLTLTVPATINAAGNGVVQVLLGAPAPVALQGTLTLSFVSNANNTPANYVDPALAFAGAAPGSPRTIPFTIAQGATTAVIAGNGAFSPGTVSGTITITLSALTGSGQNLLPNPAPSRDIAVERTAPSIVSGSVRITNVTGGFQVELSGISAPRDLRSITYTFTASGTSILEGSSVTVDVSALFNAYFASEAGRNAGGTFRFTMPFTVSGGDAAAVTSVTVTMTNSVGTSAAVSGGR